jgi:MoaA/NifB/PqqE/SkfB family radical SAM enzyme
MPECNSLAKNFQLRKELSMPEVKQTSPFLENIGLFVTFKCQVACSHCLVQAGPHRTEETTLSDALDWISQIAAYEPGTIRSINFTGGEPLFNLAAFRQLVAATLSQGLLPTAVTNAYWAVTPTVAVEILKTLPGLLFLQISADEYHQAQIPLERIENAVRASREVGIFYQISVCVENGDDIWDKDFIKRIVGIAGKEHIQIVPTIPVVFSPKPETALPQEACGGASTPVIFPDGSVKPCMGPIMHVKGDHPLILGNLRKQNLSDIFNDAQTNTVLHFLRIWGPARILQLLKESCPDTVLFQDIQGEDVCSLCCSLFSRAELHPAILALFRDRELIETTAYARSQYLKEPQMMARLGL